MRKTHPFLTLWESHRFKSDGNRFSTRGVRKAVGIWRGAISGDMKVSFQAARSIG